MIEVRENFISLSYQNAISNLASSKTLEWYYEDRTMYNADIARLEDDTPQLTHALLTEGKHYRSNHYQFFYPLILSMQDTFNIVIKDVVRVKLNMTLKLSDNNIIHPPHVDTFQTGLVSVVYYADDYDGDTVLYNEVLTDKEKDEWFSYHYSKSRCNPIVNVSPKKGKAVMFDSNRLHSSSTPCLSDRRIVLNCVFQI